MFGDSTILVTGGTGSWGNELISQLLLRNPKEIRVFSRSELNQVNMQRAFDNPRLSFYIGDVRDYNRLYEACEGVDYIFHLAALKHVPVCEHQPYEAMKTNVSGTENVIRAAIARNVKKVIDVSTDKAVDPLNFYGMTKAVGEKLIIHANTLSARTRFICIRAGNVLGTNGSVVPFFLKQIRTEGRVSLTDRRMTRYFLTLADAIGLLFKAAEKSVGGETFVMRMPSCRIKDLAMVLARRSDREDVQIIEIGIRPGEKLHEVLISANETPQTVQYDENYYVILPSLPIAGLWEQYRSYARVAFREYASNDALLSEADIEAMLEAGGFLPRKLVARR